MKSMYCKVKQVSGGIFIEAGKRNRFVCYRDKTGIPFKFLLFVLPFVLDVIYHF